MADRSLERLANNVEEVADGLLVFRDSLPQATSYVTSIISECWRVSSQLRELEQAEEDPLLQLSMYRIAPDVVRLRRSLGMTLQDVRDMFARSRDRSRQMVWDDLQHRMANVEHLALGNRLEFYRNMLSSLLDVLYGRHVQHELEDMKRRLMMLLDVQETAAVRTAGLLPEPRISPIFPPPRPAYRIDTPWSPAELSDDYDPFSMPPPVAPEAPPLSPTITSRSSQTLDSSETSYSDESRGLVEYVHWAQNVFDGEHECTRFRENYICEDRSVCYGKPDPRTLHHLRQDKFIRLLQIPFDREQLWMRFYWRRRDDRARIMLMQLDSSGQQLHYCAPLTNLKIIRHGSCLQLCKPGSGGQYNLWARLCFQLYERMVLFYSTFLALKYQDPHPLSTPLLRDSHELRGDSARFEFEVFGGVILEPSSSNSSSNARHALRLLRDRTSGVVRLEACPLTGNMRAVPIWTAFVTRYVGDTAWAEYRHGGLVNLAVLKPKPYVFRAGFEVRRNELGEYLLKFETVEDARIFVEVWNGLGRTSPYR